MMSEKIAAILGSTGMIGSYLLDLLLTDDYFDTVRILVRSPKAKTDPKIEVKLVNYGDPESVKLALEGTDVIFCCIGTTQKNVKGDKELYRKIDFDIPLRAARLGKEVGCNKMILVSSIGANSQSNTFYLKLKGELEDTLQSAGMETIHIMQPSMLLGKRVEYRGGERISQSIMKIISPLFVGGMAKYKAIHGKTVAIAMMNAAKKDKKGFFRYTYDDIKRLAEDF
jgi:uncharacterized protein YbjT (DUF2867 family)